VGRGDPSTNISRIPPGQKNMASCRARSTRASSTKMRGGAQGFLTRWMLMGRLSRDRRRRTVRDHHNLGRIGVKSTRSLHTNVEVRSHAGVLSTFRCAGVGVLKRPGRHHRPTAMGGRRTSLAGVTNRWIQRFRFPPFARLNPSAADRPRQGDMSSTSAAGSSNSSRPAPLFRRQNCV